MYGLHSSKTGKNYRRGSMKLTKRGWGRNKRHKMSGKYKKFYGSGNNWAHESYNPW